ncbi:hypothetical protein D3C76_1297780 [compost metagenome]
MFGSGLGMLGGDEPLTLWQRDISPAGHTGFADTRAVAQHHQGQHGVTRCAIETLSQKRHDLRQLDATQACWLGHDASRSEVGELHAGHRVSRDQVQLVCLTECGRQQAIELLHVGQ